ncbi:chemotaxis protein [Leptospira ognonensis]|uniref:Probable chemoreceptor glutamine deamidase CheD n=1 Tax=Leptospira ognonensis TaxID=2484945 RepID=A0A4R9K806_9LEPT|nr:chemotaxis protein CheD [Leptospira ognonensis]TGL61782.1 chemotaxis protein [Leptospira ognonensis]
MSIKSKIINVGIADIKVGQGDVVLRTTLGSCIGIVLYDPDQKIGGLSHIMLAKDPTGKDNLKFPHKYGETALPELVKMMTDAGSPVGKFYCRMFGGASMFKGINSNFLQNIGEQNILIVRKFMETHKIPIIVEDIAGNEGRTISLYCDDGRVLLKKAGMEKYLYKVR